MFWSLVRLACGPQKSEGGLSMHLEVKTPVHAQVYARQKLAALDEKLEFRGIQMCMQSLNSDGKPNSPARSPNAHGQSVVTSDSNANKPRKQEV